MHDLRAAARRVARVVATVSLSMAALAAALQLIGQIVRHPGLIEATSGWLVPPLAVFLVARVIAAPAPTAGGRRRQVAWMVAALMACWLGDLTDQVLPKLAAFLVGHVCFGVAWWRWRRAGVLWQPRGRVPAVLVALSVAVGMVWLLAPRVGAMIVPMAAYAGCICTMALLATCLGRAGAIGGAAFVVSDALLAVDWFVHPVPMGGLLIMSTYIAAGWLLTLATAGRLTASWAGDPDGVPGVIRTR